MEPSHNALALERHQWSLAASSPAQHHKPEVPSSLLANAMGGLSIAIAGIWLLNRDRDRILAFDPATVESTASWGRCGRGSEAELTEVRGNIDSVSLENVERDDVEDALMSRSQHHWSCCAGQMCSQPIGGGDTPAIPRHQARKPELRHWCSEVVADAPLVF